jgi:1-acyl-sn-glycerol-3-phosphate acyltransferase
LSNPSGSTVTPGGVEPLHPLRLLFFWLVVRPLVLVVLGLNVRHRERLPQGGPAIIVANHNSHLDTMVLITLLPSHQLRLLRPVAAADYFLRNPAMAWFSQRIIGILPIFRGGRGGSDPLAGPSAALERGEIVILFPEGTRGEPERLASLKSGIGHLAKRHSQVPVVPVFLHGLGKSLPKGAFLPVPLFCDVFIGEPLFGLEDHNAFLASLGTKMADLASEGHFPEWD